jgi:hypothetical protein
LGNFATSGFILGPQERSWQLNQPFVATQAKFGKTNGSIVDGVKRNHNGGRIFTPRIFDGQWGPHIISTLKAQQAKLVKNYYFLCEVVKKESPLLLSLVVPGLKAFVVICQGMYFVGGHHVFP